MNPARTKKKSKMAGTYEVRGTFTHSERGENIKGEKTSDDDGCY